MKSRLPSCTVFWKGYWFWVLSLGSVWSSLNFRSWDPLKCGLLQFKWLMDHSASLPVWGSWCSARSQHSMWQATFCWLPKIPADWGGKKPRMHSNYSCNCSCFSAVSEDWIQIVRNKYSIMMLPKEWGRNTRMPWPGKRKTFSELSTALSFVEVIHLCNFVTWESEHWLIRKPFSPKG